MQKLNFLPPTCSFSPIPNRICPPTLSIHPIHAPRAFPTIFSDASTSNLSILFTFHHHLIQSLRLSPPSSNTSSKFLSYLSSNTSLYDFLIFLSHPLFLILHLETPLSPPILQLFALTACLQLLHKFISVTIIIIFAHIGNCFHLIH